MSLPAPSHTAPLFFYKGLRVGTQKQQQHTYTHTHKKGVLAGGGIRLRRHFLRPAERSADWPLRVTSPAQGLARARLPGWGNSDHGQTWRGVTPKATLTDAAQKLCEVS
ncbi:hypothetical protein E2320_014046 [Naja naja]|nr:hypothetical protein E2320_014046 [Naja naja]